MSKASASQVQKTLKRGKKVITHLTVEEFLAAALENNEEFLRDTTSLYLIFGNSLTPLNTRRVAGALLDMPRVAVIGVNKEELDDPAIRSNILVIQGVVNMHRGNITKNLEILSVENGHGVEQTFNIRGGGSIADIFDILQNYYANSDDEIANLTRLVTNVVEKGLLVIEDIDDAAKRLSKTKNNRRLFGIVLESILQSKAEEFVFTPETFELIEQKLSKHKPLPWINLDQDFNHMISPIRAIYAGYLHSLREKYEKKIQDVASFESGSDLADGIADKIARIEGMHDLFSSEGGGFHSMVSIAVGEALTMLAIRFPKTQNLAADVVLTDDNSIVRFYDYSEIVRNIEVEHGKDYVLEPSNNVMVELSRFKPLVLDDDLLSQYSILLSGLTFLPGSVKEIMESDIFAQFPNEKKEKLLQKFSKVLDAIDDFEEVSQEVKDNASEQKNNVDNKLQEIAVLIKIEKANQAQKEAETLVNHLEGASEEAPSGSAATDSIETAQLSESSQQGKGRSNVTR